MSGNCWPTTLIASIRRFLGACCEVTLQREEREKPWCLTDNALPCDTPQLAAGRLHCGPLRSGATGQSLHPPRDGSGGTTGGRRWRALPSRQLASVAGPPRLSPPCPHPAV